MRESRLLEPNLIWVAKSCRLFEGCKRRWDKLASLWLRRQPGYFEIVGSGYLGPIGGCLLEVGL